MSLHRLWITTALLGLSLAAGWGTAPAAAAGPQVPRTQELAVFLHGLEIFEQPREELHVPLVDHLELRQLLQRADRIGRLPVEGTAAIAQRFAEGGWHVVIHCGRSLAEASNLLGQNGFTVDSTEQSSSFPVVHPPYRARCQGTKIMLTQTMRPEHVHAHARAEAEAHP